MDDNIGIALVAMLFAAMGLFALPRRVADERRIRDETERMRHLAHHDSLTGLGNRMLLDGRLEGALARAARTDTQIAFIAIDLDRFKQVNDQHGHHTGDETLKRVADAILSSIRTGDTAARIGGDEFAVLQEGGDQPFAAMALAERISERIRNTVSNDDRLQQVSASIGIAVFPDDSIDASMLRRQADMAMYRAKAMGRDQYSIYANSGRGREIDDPEKALILS